MKKLLYLVLIGTSLLSASCSKTPLCCVLPPPIVMTAQKNGVAWVLPIIKSSINDQNIIQINTAGPYLLNTAIDSVSINLAYTGLGAYKLTDQQITYTVFANGTKINYMLDTTFANSIDITEYAVLYNPGTTNPDPTELKAIFNLRFVDPGHTTSVSLLNGKFTVYLSN
jgi:hypothetical protein